MYAKKLTKEEISKFRDDFVMHVVQGYSGVTKEFAINEAYKMADIALSIREKDAEAFESDCDCNKGPQVRSYKVDGGDSIESIAKKLTKPNPSKFSWGKLIVGLSLLFLVGVGSYKVLTYIWTSLNNVF